MNGATLELHWIAALDAAADAIAAAAHAGTLPRSECVSRSKAIATERAWLSGVDWSLAERPCRILSLVEVRAEPGALRAAA